MSATSDRIQLKGVRVHNLRGISVDIPLGRFVVVTGVSGSGKSSLAFDTLYAEGRRRYVEAFSPQVRRHLERFERPEADFISPLPPAVAVRQSNDRPDRRATVGTATEILDFLQLVFAHAGTAHCLNCGQIVRRDTPETVRQWLGQFGEGRRFQIGFPVTLQENGSDPAALWSQLVADGFSRVFVGNRTYLLPEELPPDDAAADAVVVVDRLTSGRTSDERLRDSLELAFRAGDGTCLLLFKNTTPEGGRAGDPSYHDEREWRSVPFRSDLRCAACGTPFPELEPRLFNFRSRLGACPVCRGTGVTVDGRSRTESICTACDGARWQAATLAVRVGGQTIAQLCSRTAADLLAEWTSLFEDLTDRDQRVLAQPREEIRQRLVDLVDSGLGYVTLDRSLATLSTGEARRTALTAVLGSPLVNTLYVLDEPSAGLHPSDTARLLDAIHRLHSLGNTVVVVEHKPEFFTAAEHLIELGPGAGPEGGQVTFVGTPTEAVICEESSTGQVLKEPPVLGTRRHSATGHLTLRGARQYNLQNVTVEFPLGVLCVVSGVSGSGKTTLVHETLYSAVARNFGKADGPDALCDGVDGVEQIDDVVLADQIPLSHSARSNPVTYLKAFADVRQIFAETAESRLRNFTARHFSLNVADGGRCPRCQGSGELAVDMQFLPDATVICPECQGTRFQREILDVTYRGLNIAEVLALTVNEAFPFFRTAPKLARRLGVLRDVGLGYVRLGQPLHTLSGGEAQRLKLAGTLAAGTKSRTLFLVDEPSLGLHPHDIDRLVECFRNLLDVGHSVVVVEHNLRFIRQADFVIDLGPGAANEGGRVVATGTPADIAKNSASITGRYIEP